jgi:hypothetical protein
VYAELRHGEEVTRLVVRKACNAISAAIATEFKAR